MDNFSLKGHLSTFYVFVRSMSLSCLRKVMVNKLTTQISLSLRHINLEVLRICGTVGDRNERGPQGLGSSVNKDRNSMNLQ